MPYRPTYRNNLVYGITGYWAGLPQYPYLASLPGLSYSESHNTWDWYDEGTNFVMTDTVTVNEADFVVSDSASIVAQLTAPRNLDGSYSNATLSAFRLVSGSDLIGAGTDVGMSATPDIGIDWNYLDPPKIPAVVNGKFAKSIRGNLLIFNQ
jgi:hypothetical protein